MAGSRGELRVKVHFYGWCKHYGKLIYWDDLKIKNCRMRQHGKPCKHWVDDGRIEKNRSLATAWGEMTR